MKFFLHYIFFVTSLFDVCLCTFFNIAYQGLTDWPTVPAGTTTIVASGNQLTDISGAAIAPVASTLNILMLSDNALENIDGLSLLGNNLKSLDLNSNLKVATALDSTSFATLSGLTKLYLSDTGINGTKIPTDIFAHVATTLLRLILSGNNIEYVSCQELHIFVVLEELDLSECGIKSLTNMSCLSDTLKSINLEDNSFSQLDDNIFLEFNFENVVLSHLLKLPYLHIVGSRSMLEVNNIDNLSLDILSQSEINYLNIRLSNIYTPIFSNLRIGSWNVLETLVLDISHPPILSIPAEHICKLQELRWFTINVNVPSLGNLTCLTKLNELTLHRSIVHHIPSDIFIRMSSLGELELDDVYIDCFEQPQLRETGSPSVRITFWTTFWNCSCCMSWILDPSTHGSMDVRLEVPDYNRVCLHDESRPDIQHTHLSDLTKEKMCLSCVKFEKGEGCLYEEGESIEGPRFNITTSTKTECALRALQVSNSNLYSYNQDNGFCIIY